MTETIKRIPAHLHKYIVEQNYEKYTWEDQEVWRFIMHQLQDFLSTNAHEVYVSGLSKTGISTENIPKIPDMDKKLQQYGWRAVPVSGFIPPAAFMEFQAHGILPIASDMRSVEHILYTPAPDIVHEAAGHAPILVDPDFSRYLNSYAEVANKAILSSEDLALYDAIRNLSDVKESAHSTQDEIKACEKKLETVVNNMTYVSEAQLLGRMNWWTAEYGLIGPINKPKIFGAGLLSSIGESRQSLTAPKKIPLTVDCLNFSYDITEQQPQLFVTPDFQNLISVLEAMSETMAYKLGGEEALKRALIAKTVCTIILDGGLAYSGIVENYEYKKGLTFINFKGPVQISNDQQFVELIESPYYDVSFNDPIEVISVHGGPKYFEHFPILDDFVATRVPEKKRSDYDIQKFNAYNQLRNLRTDAEATKKMNFSNFEKLFKSYLSLLNNEWLLGLGLLELVLKYSKSESTVIDQLNHSILNTPDLSKDERSCIELGFELFKKQGLL